MIIASTTADFFRYVPHTLDIENLLPPMKESGFRYIDLSFYGAFFEGSPLLGDNWQDWAEKAAECAEALGLRYVQSHGSNLCYKDNPEYELRRELVRREMHVCKRLGIPNIVVHCIYQKGKTRDDFIAENTELYLDLLKFSEETGVAVCTENTCVTNCPTYYLVNAADFHALDAAIGHHPLFGICWDVGHAHIEGVDQYREMTALGSRMRAVHIHDNIGMRQSPVNMDTHMQPYAGSCCYDAILKALTDMHFPGPFTLEAHSIPVPAKNIGRVPFEKDGVVYDRLLTLPLSFKVRTESLMYDITRHMLECYDCFDE